MARRLSASFRVAEWESYVGTYQTSLCDGPSSRLSLGGRIIAVDPQCNSGAESAERVVPILEAVRAAIEELSEAGTATSAVRYVLVAEGTVEQGGLTTSSAAYRGAPRWPLSVEPADVATPLATAEQTPDAIVSHCVEGEDAKKLWAIGDAYARGEIGSPGYFAPVLDSAGRGYRLFVRGSTPFEDGSGRWRIKRGP